MKRLVGGEYLLDLSSIEIEESVDGTTKTNITDSNVLEQFTNLKKYIKNPEMAKPVWVKLKNGENDELVIARGTFAVVDTGEFEICVPLDGYKLVIFIEFTQVLNSDNVPMEDWYIDTNDAKYLFTSDAQNIGAILSTGEIENAKPIYFHGLNVYGNAPNNSFEMHILNNNNTPIDTIAKLKAWAESLTGVVLLAGHGCISIEGTFYNIIGIQKFSDNSYTLYYIDPTLGSQPLNSFDFAEHFSVVEDAINKIN